MANNVSCTKHYLTQSISENTFSIVACKVTILRYKGQHLCKQQCKIWCTTVRGGDGYFWIGTPGQVSVYDYIITINFCSYRHCPGTFYIHAEQKGPHIFKASVWKTQTALYSTYLPWKYDGLRYSARIWNCGPMSSSITNLNIRPLSHLHLPNTSR